MTVSFVKAAKSSCICHKSTWMQYQTNTWLATSISYFHTRNLIAKILINESTLMLFSYLASKILGARLSASSLSSTASFISSLESARGSFWLEVTVINFFVVTWLTNRHRPRYFAFRRRHVFWSYKSYINKTLCWALSRWGLWSDDTWNIIMDNLFMDNLGSCSLVFHFVAIHEDWRKMRGETFSRCAHRPSD